MIYVMMLEITIVLYYHIVKMECKVAQMLLSFKSISV